MRALWNIAGAVRNYGASGAGGCVRGTSATTMAAVEMYKKRARAGGRRIQKTYNSNQPQHNELNFLPAASGRERLAISNRQPAARNQQTATARPANLQRKGENATAAIADAGRVDFSSSRSVFGGWAIELGDGRSPGNICATIYSAGPAIGDTE